MNETRRLWQVTALATNGMASHNCDRGMADQDGTLLPTSTPRNRDRSRATYHRRNHRIPYIRLQEANLVLGEQT